MLGGTALDLIRTATQESRLLGAARAARQLARVAGLSPHYHFATSVALSRNHRPEGPRRLFVDITELARHDARSGIQRVVRNILRALISHPDEFRVEPVIRAGEQYLHARSFTSNFIEHPITLPDAPVEFTPDDVFLGLDLDITLTPGAIDLLQSERRRGLRVVFVVYDILPITNAPWFAEGTQEAFKRWLALVGSCADHLACISQATADAVEQFWQAEGRQVQPGLGTFYLGSDLDGDSASGRALPEDDARALSSLPIGRKIFSVVGTIEPRKGHAQVLDAFDVLWRRGDNSTLVFCGKPGWKTDDLVSRIEQHPQRGQRLFWFASLSDAGLAELYGRSTAIIASSLGEGFGLPLVEAARHGRPIIARSLSVFKEIAVGNAFYFDGDNAEALADTITKWCELLDNDRIPDSAGIRVIGWQDSAEELKRQFSSL
jgi:glycosyltransferase involved in cell wall biosynthesis